GDPFSGEIDPNNTSPEYIEEMREKLGYNDPIPVQYQRWVADFVQGDFGKSTKYKKPAIDVIKEKLPNTIFLAITSLTITYIFAFVFGMYAGREPYTLGDHGIAVFNYGGIAIPHFIITIVAIYFFAFQLIWFPSGGSITPGLESGKWVFWIVRIYHYFLLSFIFGMLFTVDYYIYYTNNIL